ncbi:enoyl-CoA hydratase/isomerase family protein [Marinobacter lutaoensis]|jgi:enoyl-CoA hydratase/carnithine racemase|uniref:enoyl-CoA hydratase/isomerase family protein n=1 Tax=Marinobacter lutaoensis TaxID=135739 RepID=UPI000C64431F|nr:enoyl-CoA hydratase/isomerase family protein [Marinobacter lutaoensis]MBI42927.1 enoyl-CoA hydratase [Oceanospirillales bacterium]NVD34537.1 enoyl-CoA hydratase/isomerase family protein [Marinobacter lutaoensis]|tara:strand:- start:915 stop:2006 length:1092 start_codon:yes stop_codon:yes gene_type:complete
MSDQPLVFEEWPAGDASVIAAVRIHSPRNLNSLSLDMIRLLRPRLEAWAEDERVVAVWLEAEGDKAFCAGGDIVSLYRSMTEPGGSDLGEAFFREEYLLDHQIHEFPKPVICWGHGIVMGGGIGLMVGASHRVVTEASRLAMPEVNIGLYPDVGAGWFLNRMPGRLGLFLGLTGARMNAADALYTGMADRFIQHAFKSQVIDTLRGERWQGRDAHGVIGSVLRQFEARSREALPESPLRRHYDDIQRATDADTLVDTVAQLQELAGRDDWLGKSVRGLTNASPTSLALTWRHLRSCRLEGLRAVLDKERVLSVNCLHKGEFAEGVRALLIDKDLQPRWRYPSLVDLDTDWIEDFFREHDNNKR